MAIEIVDFPIKMMIFHSYVSSPEGISFLWRQEAKDDLQWVLRKNVIFFRGVLRGLGTCF